MASSSLAVSGSNSVVRRFTLRQALTSAAIFGFICAAESVAQVVGIVAAYPNVVDRAKVISGLASNPALGLFYGDRHVDIISPGGYMVYRILPILVLILSIWALTYITKMLRGQEENGRWELLLAGKTSARAATADTIMGAGGGIVLAYAITTLLLSAIGKNPKYNISFASILFYGLALVAGAVVTLGIGAITSQLAATRRRAVLYGVGIVIIFFALRSIGNVVDGLAWLKNLTPFGWIDKMHPIVAPQALWLIPLGLLAVTTCGVAIWLAGKRDMDDSFIADSDTTKPKYRLLNSQLGFDFRETRNVLAGWLFANLLFSSLIAGIDKDVAKSLSSTNKLTHTISNITGNATARIEIAYLSAASYFTLIVLLLMITSGINAIRDEEGSGRLDNFLSGTVTRLKWLGSRILLLSIAAIVITLVSSFVVWALAEGQGIHTSIVTLLFGGLSILGPVAFLLGLGIFLYAAIPRLATIILYFYIAWSFTVDIIVAAVKTNKYLADTSILHHIALVPAANPKWEAFSILAGIGFLLTVIGLFIFHRRDLEAE